MHIATKRSDQLPRPWAARAGDRVFWIGRAPAAEDEEAAAVHAAIVERGLSRFAEVVTCVAGDLFARDFRRCGWAADIGFFRSWYRAGACRLLERLDGTAVVIVPGDPPDAKTA